TWLANRAGSHTRIEIDGGIDVDTTKQAVTAGAEVLVAGSAIFGAADREAVIRQMHSIDLPARPI
ncbi:MAG: ribulose-phosphate 3-epimerase, partial [Rhodospirillales bacterium]|nr:ribulose-phosphate 3-epimerase [Rhodospirillales bacterium]